MLPRMYITQFYNIVLILSSHLHIEVSKKSLIKQDMATFTHGELKTWYLLHTRLDEYTHDSNPGIL